MNLSRPFSMSFCARSSSNVKKHVDVFKSISWRLTHLNIYIIVIQTRPTHLKSLSGPPRIPSHAISRRSSIPSANKHMFTQLAKQVLETYKIEKSIFGRAYECLLFVPKMRSIPLAPRRARTRYYCHWIAQSRSFQSRKPSAP